MDTSQSKSDLFGQIQFNQCSALNVEGNSNTLNIKGLFTGSSYIKSNIDDPELIIFIKFMEKVSLTGIKLESGMERDNHPQTVKLYSNNNNLDFADVESLAPSETISINDNNYGTLFNLKLAKFKNIDELAVQY